MARLSRVVSLFWAAYAASRVVAYRDSAPPQLLAVDDLMPLWVPWAVATLLLLLGALIAGNGWAHRFRQWGITLSVATLLMWSGAFLLADHSRGWVTSVSYLWLAVSASVTGYISALSRDRGSPGQEGGPGVGVA